MNSKKKWEYFSKKLETTWSVYLDCMKNLDAKFSEEWKNFWKSGDKEHYKEYLHEIEFPYINTLNSSMLIAFCSLTEHVIADITNEKVSEYEEKMKQKRGNWLVRNIELLNEQGFSIDKDREDVRFLCHYIQIRNCLVHNGGKISNSKHLKQLQDAINAVEKYAKDHNFNMIKIKDDYLMLGSDLISDVVVQSEELIERLLEKI